MLITLTGCGTAQNSDIDVQGFEQDQEAIEETGSGWTRWDELVQIRNFIQSDDVQNMIDSFGYITQIMEAAKTLDLDSAKEATAEINKRYSAIVHMDYPEAAYNIYYNVGKLGMFIADYAYDYSNGIELSLDGSYTKGTEYIEKGNSNLQDGLDVLDELNQQISDIFDEIESYRSR